MPKEGYRKKSSQRSRIARRSNSFYGWVPDLPDHRDFLYAAPRKFLRALPSRVDLRTHCPPIYSQGKLHSCTAHAIAAAIQFDKMKQSRPEIFVPSRLFIYYNERAIERSIHSDSGAQIRTGIKSVAKRGVCHERLWPYRTRKFRQKPWRKCYTEAVKHPTLTYHRVRRTLPQLKACLASGYPFIFGFTVYESFHSKKVRHTGRASMPGTRRSTAATRFSPWAMKTRNVASLCATRGAANGECAGISLCLTIISPTTISHRIFGPSEWLSRADYHG